MHYLGAMTLKDFTIMEETLPILSDGVLSDEVRHVLIYDDNGTAVRIGEYRHEKEAEDARDGLIEEHEGKA